MTSELITFNHLRCHSSSTALETRNGEVQMKPPLNFVIKSHWKGLLIHTKMSLQACKFSAAIINWCIYGTSNEEVFMRSEHPFTRLRVSNGALGYKPAIYLKITWVKSTQHFCHKNQVRASTRCMYIKATPPNIDEFINFKPCPSSHQ